MDVDIQLATADDVAIIHAIMQETVANLERREFFVDDDQGYLERHIDQAGFVLLARNGPDCLGFLMVDLPGEGENNLGRDLGWPVATLGQCAHIDSVCVRPAFRGHGLQKRLVGDAEARLERMGIIHFLATVHPDNIASLASMRALGYQIGATKPKYGGMLRHILYKSPPSHDKA